MADIVARGLSSADKNYIKSRFPSQDAFPFTLTKHGSPIIAYPPTQTVQQMGYVSVLRVDKFLANPIDKFYMWAAAHDDGDGTAGIWLYTAPDPLGPWTLQGRVFGIVAFGVSPSGSNPHVSSPDVHWVPEENRFRIYFHCNGKDVNPFQHSYLAFTADGLTNVTFYSNNPLIPAPLTDIDAHDQTYLKSIRIGMGWYGFYQGASNDASQLYTSPCMAYSPDGLNWYKDQRIHVHTNQYNVELLGTSVIYSPAPLMLGNTLWLFYSPGNSSTWSEIYVGAFHDGDLIMGPRVIPMGASGAFDSAQVDSAAPLIYNGTLYVYYYGCPTTANTGNNVSVAYAPLPDIY